MVPANDSHLTCILLPGEVSLPLSMAGDMPAHPGCWDRDGVGAGMDLILEFYSTQGSIPVLGDCRWLATHSICPLCAAPPTHLCEQDVHHIPGLLTMFHGTPLTPSV